MRAILDWVDSIILSSVYVQDKEKCGGIHHRDGCVLMGTGHNYDRELWGLCAGYLWEHVLAVVLMKEQNKVLKYMFAYGMWFVNLGLATWLLFITRPVLLVIPTLLFDPDDYFYPGRVETFDKFFTLLLGIGWLVFMVISEEYFRAGALKGNLTKRVARITGSILLCIFVVDSILFGLASFDGNWSRWLMLPAELVIGLVLVMYSRKNVTRNPS